MRGRNLASTLAAIACLATGAAMAAGAGRPDWSGIPSTEITPFYPGQASYQWLQSAAHKNGAAAVRRGKPCIECHVDEEADIGNGIVGGETLEPSPIAGKPGTLQLRVQAAYDKEYFYLRARWPTHLKEAGAFHNYRVFKGGSWVTYGSNRTDKAVQAGTARASYEDRFNLMLGDNQGSVAEFKEQGCWVTCHNPMRDMPNAPTSAQVKAHPVLGDAGMKKSDIRKYLPATRSAMDDAGSWDQVKSREELDALMAKGVYLDLWQARAYRSIPVGRADDSHVFQYRNFDAGRKPFDSNWDDARGQPRFMFDPARNGGRVALTEAQFRDPAAPKLDDTNSVPFDPARVRDGDILPGFILNTRTDGSAADLDASGSWANGMWTITLRRKLTTGHKDDVALMPGQSYPIGLAVHDDNVTTRFHYVSFPLTLGVGAEGDIQAQEIK